MKWIALAVVFLALCPVSAAQPRKATLATFAGEWVGHTRSLLVTRIRRATEVIDDGCCTRVLELELQLSRPGGTTANATVSARVTAVKLYNVRTYWRKGRGRTSGRSPRSDFGTACWSTRSAARSTATAAPRRPRRDSAEPDPTFGLITGTGLSLSLRASRFKASFAAEV